MKKNEKRTSVVIIISLLFISIVVLFITSSALSYLRLNEFQSVLSKITNNSIPNILRSAKIYNKINELTFLTESLVNATSDAAHRIAYQKIQTRLNEIDQVITKKKIDSSIENQLNGLMVEVSSLNVLVEQRLILNQILSDKTQQMFHLYEQLLMYSREEFKKTTLGAAGQYNTHIWALKYSELLINSEKSLSIHRLQFVRKTEKSTLKGMIELESYIEFFPVEKQPLAKELTLKLKKLLIGANSLFALRIKQLRLIGRVRGRGNFVKNIADDFARVIDFQLYKTNKKVINETENTSQHILKQTYLMVISSIIIFILLFGVIFFIKNRFVKRLIGLNEQILARLSGKDISINIAGNDEIADIANSFNFYAKQIEEQKHTLHQLSMTDGLTGIANRRSLDERLLQELNRAKRNQLTLSVLLIDIDYFKLYNDHYGHIAGDDCLKQTTKILNSCKQRSNDFVARYGGEEFVFILPNTDVDGAKKFAENVNHKINKANIPHVYSKIVPHITLSIGIANYRYNDDIDVDAILKKADEALYQAKSNGRNCIFTF
jgi:diguanylate cyclase (GGDEF)-like protein